MPPAISGVAYSVRMLFMPNQPANAMGTKMSRHTKPALRIQVSAPDVDYRPLFPPGGCPLSLLKFARQASLAEQATRLAS